MVNTHIVDGNVSEQTASGVKQIIARCDAARFAAGSLSSSDGLELVSKTRDILKAVEREYRG